MILNIRIYSDNFSSNKYLEKITKEFEKLVTINNKQANLDKLSLSFLFPDIKETSNNLIFIIDICHLQDTSSFEKKFLEHASKFSSNHLFLFLKKNHAEQLDNPKTYLELNKNNNCVSLFSNNDLDHDLDKLNVNFNSFLKPSYNSFSNLKGVLFIGGSIGAISVIHEIFNNLNMSFKKKYNNKIDRKKLPPIIITQHITSQFSTKFIGRLSSMMPFYSIIPLDSNYGALKLSNGNIYVSIDEHTVIDNVGGSFLIKASGTHLVSEHCPSIDVMFESGYKAFNNTFNILKLGVILTGMGYDGVAGIKEFYKLNNVKTIAQDSKSSIVHGIASKAIENGLIDEVGDAEKIADIIFKEFEKIIN